MSSRAESWTSCTIHVLLVLAIMMALIRIIQGRRPV